MRPLWSLTRRLTIICLLTALCAGAALAASETPAPEGADNFQVRAFQDNGQALVNPMMGWTLHYHSNILANYGSRLAPSDTLDDFPGLSVIYLRLPWAFLEPLEGDFNWTVLDTPAQRWLDKGMRIALRITCSESWMRWATPEWVHHAGAKGYDFTTGQGVVEGGHHWEPDYADPIFLEKHERFLAALAARYDGNPNVAFIDIGSYGVWGEGHTHASTRLEVDLATKKKHIDMALRHFPNTLLALNDDYVGHSEPIARHAITDYALGKGITLRDDSICVQPPPNSWYHAELAQPFWPALPVILEHEHFGSSKERGAWGDGSLLEQAVEEYHASYLSIHWWPREFLEENRAVIDRINLRLGYRIMPRSIAIPRVIRKGEAFEIVAEWFNAGVAPCYPGGHVAYTLKDEKGGVVACLVDNGFDVRDLAVGAPGDAEATEVRTRLTVARPVSGYAPATPTGPVDVFVSVGSADGTPRIALPLGDDDGARRYRIGQMALTDGTKAQ